MRFRKRTLRIGGLIAAALAVPLAAFGFAGGTAYGETGRRLCVYTENEDGWTEFGRDGRGDRKYNAYVAVNYTKNKKRDCPVVDTDPKTRSFRWKVGEQPVKKIRCEDWPAKANPWPGKDVCTQIPADAVFEARVYDDGSPTESSIGADIYQFQRGK